MLSRRAFLFAAAGVALSRAAGAEPMAGRELRFRIGEDFGDASAKDIEAVLRSAAETLWVHCPGTRWEVPGFFVFHREGSPIILDDHRADGRVAVGLEVQGRHWAQFAFQFAHEFCHALAGHSGAWEKRQIRGRHACLWVEESLCETASLFALRAMGQGWLTRPPYPNFRDFARHLTSYAQDRLDQAQAAWNAGEGLPAWLRREEPGLRAKGTQREKNLVVASQLLPLFEAEPAGWEALTACNLAPRRPERSLAEYLADWLSHAPAGQRPFLRKIAEALGVEA